MGAGLFGYDLGVIAYVIVAPDFLETIGNPSTSYIGFIVSSMLLGYVSVWSFLMHQYTVTDLYRAFVGSIPASLIADAFSRRTASTSYLTYPLYAP